MANEHIGLNGVLSLYPTPVSLIYEMVDKLPIQPGDTILEPSAGTGAIARLLREEYPDNPLYVIEKDFWLKVNLTLDGFTVVDEDFFFFNKQVDWVIQNPPFSNNYQDINHFCQAWRVARKGVVSLLHEYSGFAPWGKPKIFQNWFLKQGISRSMNPQGSFLTSEMPSNVSTCMLWGVKDGNPTH